ncbi:DUF547 domain-containing protein [Hymenobacter sp. AT01-02]|uniref:DUF547 domain-containing protein n=1 Tax=Hymenobacter sp. AT01-02 TaxID=1571877 RepID=UPI000A672218|nr:DUF547 domain-containing protein [Hymenobacter sp. AT01-02]
MPTVSRLLYRFLGGLFLFMLPCFAAQADDNNALELLHEPWNALLMQHSTLDGHVDYQGMLEEEDKLLDYLLSLRKVNPRNPAWSSNDAKAFWLNTYNAAATYLVLQYYPISSINDIRVKTVGGQKSPWDAPVVEVGGQSYSLNQIERQMLTAQFHDPRVHFGLLYTAASAPAPLAEAYDGTRINQQLDAQARRFINDPTFNQLASGQVQVSGLFDAYSAEFGTETASLLS